MKHLTLTLIGLILSLSSVAFAAIEEKIPVVFTAVAERTTHYESLTYPAQLIPEVHASILSESQGLVTELKTPLGTAVKKGQILLSIRHQDPVYNYAPVQIRSPVDGVVSSVKVTKGNLVKLGQELMTVTDPQRFKVVAELTASDLHRIRVSDQGQFEVRSGERTELFPVEVVGKSPFVDPATGTATCELKMNLPIGPKRKDNQPIRPGLVGRIRFQINPRETFFVPDRAITYQGKEPFLRLVIDGKAKKIPVEIGTRTGESVEILSGLSLGDTFIIRSSQFVKDNSEVKIYEEPKKQSEESDKKGA